MTSDRQLEIVGGFFANCFDTMKQKTRDYTPEEVTLLDVFHQAFELGCEPEEVLFTVLLGKHLTAIRHYVKFGKTQSESIGGRLTDAVNYLAILHLLIAHYDEICEAIQCHLVGSEPCTCTFIKLECERCRFLAWTQVRKLKHTKN